MSTNIKPYIFNAEEGESPQSIAQKRRMIAALTADVSSSAPRNVGEGISALGKGLAARIGHNKLNKREQEGMASLQGDLGPVYDALEGGFGGGAGAPAGAGSAAPDGSMMSAYNAGQELIGMGEVPDRATLSEYLKNGGQNLDPATTAWCAAFVNASIAKGGGQGTGKLNARSYLDWGQPVDAPQKGDVAVFSRGDPNGWQGHVGFYDSTNPDGSINVLGGNQGDKVSISPYPADKLLGYRRGSTEVASTSSLPGRIRELYGETSTAGYAPPRVTQPGNLANQQRMDSMPQPGPQQMGMPQQPVRRPQPGPQPMPGAQPGPQPPVRVAQAGPGQQGQPGNIPLPVLLKAANNPWLAKNPVMSKVVSDLIQLNIAQTMPMTPQQKMDLQYKQIQMEKSLLDMAKTRQEMEMSGKTNDAQNFEYGQENPAFRQYQLENQRAGRDQNIGTIPPGYQLVEEGQTMRLEPIPGGKADIEAQEAQTAAGQKKSSGLISTRIVTTAAQRAREAAKDRAIGPVGQDIVATINPYSDSAEVQRQVDVLKAQAKIENLNAMRRESKTGGALGNVTENESKMLAEKSGALDPSSPHFRRDLDDYELTLLQVVHGYEEGTRIFQETRQKGEGADEGVPEGVAPDLWKHMTPEERSLWQN